MTLRLMDFCGRRPAAVTVLCGRSSESGRVVTSLRISQPSGETPLIPSAFAREAARIPVFRPRSAFLYVCGACRTPARNLPLSDVDAAATLPGALCFRTS
jgi:hypothetical protein